MVEDIRNQVIQENVGGEEQQTPPKERPIRTLKILTSKSNNKK